MLMKGVAHLDNHLEFAFDEKVGYTTQWTEDMRVIDIEIEFQPRYYKYYKDDIGKKISKFDIDLRSNKN